MSRSIAIIGTDEAHRSFAVALADRLGRRLVTAPGPHDDEVIFVGQQDVASLDLELACVLGHLEGDPGVDRAAALQRLLDWAMDRGDVLTRWEHEQVMP
jgi:hypothetical protein